MCDGCKEPLKGKAFMEIYTIESKKYRKYCTDCIQDAQTTLENIQAPTPDQIELLYAFMKFLKKIKTQRRRES